MTIQHGVFAIPGDNDCKVKLSLGYSFDTSIYTVQPPFQYLNFLISELEM